MFCICSTFLRFFSQSGNFRNAPRPPTHTSLISKMISSLHQFRLIHWESDDVFDICTICQINVQYFLYVPHRFLEMLENNMRLASPVATNGQSPSSGSQSPVVPITSGSPDSSGAGTPLQMPTPTLVASPPPPAAEVSDTSGASPSTVSSPPLSQQSQQKRGFMSRLFGSSTAESPPAKPGGSLDQQETQCFC